MGQQLDMLAQILLELALELEFAEEILDKEESE
jgi:hypothetical protein